MYGVNVGIDETDGQGIDLFSKAALDDRLEGIGVQGPVDLSGGGDPLWHRQTQATLYQRLRLSEAHIIEPRCAESCDGN